MTYDTQTKETTATAQLDEIEDLVHQVGEPRAMQLLQEAITDVMPPHEAPWVREEDDARAWQGPTHRAVINGWPVEVEDKSRLLERLSGSPKTGGDGEGPARFEVFVRGHDEVCLPTLEEAKARAESMARALPGGARPGVWTACPKFMAPAGYMGEVRIEAGLFVEIARRDDSITVGRSHAIDVDVDGRIVARFEYPESPCSLRLARELAIEYAHERGRLDAGAAGPLQRAQVRHRGARPVQDWPLGRLPRALRLVALTSAVVLGALAAGSWVNSSEAARSAREAERAVNNLSHHLERAGFALPEQKGGR